MGGTVTAVVLAAGAAERMGEPKLLLALHGNTILNTTIAAVEASRVDRVVVVTGANADEVEESVVAHRSVVARNPDYRRGNMSSFLTAVEADPEADAYLLVPGDMPEIQTDVVDAMVDLWHGDAPWAAATAYTDRTAHPFLVSQAAVTELGASTGEKVLGRALVEAADHRVTRLEFAGDAPRDINRREDYETLIADPGRAAE